MFSFRTDVDEANDDGDRIGDCGDGWVCDDRDGVGNGDICDKNGGRDDVVATMMPIVTVLLASVVTIVVVAMMPFFGGDGRVAPLGPQAPRARRCSSGGGEGANA